MSVLERMWHRVLLRKEMTHSRMYEIVPGFIANCLAILLVNLVIGQKDQSILKEFDDVVSKIKSVQFD